MGCPARRCASPARLGRPGWLRKDTVTRRLDGASPKVKAARVTPGPRMDRPGTKKYQATCAACALLATAMPGHHRAVEGYGCGRFGEATL